MRHSLTKIRSLTTDLGPLPVLLGSAAGCGLPVTTVTHLIERVTRLFTASLAAIALVQTMAVTPALACDADRKTVALVLETDPVEQPTEHSDCEESSSQIPTRHSTECLRSCVSMASCGSPGLMPERLFDDVAATESVTPLSLVAAYPSRSLEPDRPPPRA